MCSRRRKLSSGPEFWCQLLIALCWNFAFSGRRGANFGAYILNNVLCYLTYSIKRTINTVSGAFRVEF